MFSPKESLVPKKIFVLLLTAFVSFIGISQSTYLISGSDVIDCSGNFYDSGNVGGDYGASESHTLTICPGGVSPTGNGIRVDIPIVTFNIDASDTLFVYDGNSTAAPLIGKWNDALTVSDIGVIASNDNTSGCLTFVFQSDAAVHGSGWQATISCDTICQPIVPNITTIPPASPSGAINVCLGDSVYFFGAATYPLGSAGSPYLPQSDATSSFLWHFSSSDSVATQNAEYVFNSSVPHAVNLQITDENGCSVNEVLTIHVAQEPEFYGGQTATEICSGDAVSFYVDSLVTDTIYSVPGGFTAGTISLPDGSGVAYTNTITITSFPAGATVASASDLVKVGVNIEHSFLGDLEMWLTCPDGVTDVLLFNSFGGAGPYIGGFGGGGTYLGDALDASVGIPGIGWNYGFTEISPDFGTMASGYTTIATTLSPGSAVDTGSYTPEESYTGFVGCPLNGDWVLNIQDNLFIDDGTLFSWEIQFAPSLIPGSDPYISVVSLGSYSWTGIDIDFTSPTSDSISASPDIPGSYDYVLSYGDDFGCTYDTTLSVTVLPYSDPSCCSISAIVSSTDITCYGLADGTIDIEASGMPAPFDYYFLNSATGDTVISFIDVFGPCPTVTDLNTGSYEILVYDVSNLCNNSFFVSINQPDEITFAVSDTIICIDGSAEISPTGLAGGTGSLTVNWVGFSSGSSLTVMPSTPTSYGVYIEDSLGCTSATQYIYVDLFSPLAITTTYSDDELCPGDTTVLTVTSTSGGDGGPYSVSWWAGSTLIGGGNSIVLSPPVSTVYCAQVNDGCTTPTAIECIDINVFEDPVVSFTSDTTKGCFPVNVQFENTSTGPAAAQTLWGFGDGNTSGQINYASNSYQNPGIYSVTLEVTTINGCFGEITLDNYITVYDYPQADFSFYPNDPTVLNPQVYFYNQSQNYITSLWDFAGLDVSTAQNSSYQFPDEAGIYPVELLVSNGEGCEDSITKNVEIKELFTLYAPNSFTPDDNLLNETFMVKGTDWDEENFNMSVYNKWGQKVFHTTDVNTGWDGKYNGQFCPNGAYLWQVNVKSKSDKKSRETTGIFRLLR